MFKHLFDYRTPSVYFCRLLHSFSHFEVIWGATRGKGSSAFSSPKDTKERHLNACHTMSLWKKWEWSIIRQDETFGDTTHHHRQYPGPECVWSMCVCLWSLCVNFIVFLLCCYVHVLFFSWFSGALKKLFSFLTKKHFQIELVFEAGMWAALFITFLCPCCEPQILAV